MNAFISANPAIVIFFITGLFSIIGSMFAIIIYLVKRSVDNLTKAITSLEVALGVDRVDIGLLKDRMQKAETTCEMQRAQCPTRQGVYPAIQTWGGV